MAEKAGPLRSAAIILAHSGDSWFWLLGLAAVWLVGNEDWKHRAAFLAAGIVVTAAVVMALKFTIRRRRPEGEWGGIYRKTDPHSFPSGHAARAFLLPMLAAGVGPTWLAAALWVWAPLVALARVAMGVHFLSDILAGVISGLVMGILFLRFAPI